MNDGIADDDEDPDKTVVSASVPRRPAAPPVPPAPTPPAFDPDATVVQPTGTPLHLRRPPPPASASTGAPVSRRPLPKSASLALESGFRLHEYRIDKVLGKGGFGITYLATDVNLNSRVAIKEYLPEEIAFRKNGQTVSAHSSRHQDRYRTGLESFLVEGRTLASFRHPNIVRVARFFEAHQTAYMVLEYERGAPLKEWWPRHATMPEKDLALLLAPLLDGLSVVHAAGFLHRDIKPDNVQVRRSDGSLVLLDFGSARQAVTSGTEAADVAVTPGYAPIEQYQDGDQGAWTDIYAMGATLHWMLTGHKPPDSMDRMAHDTLKPLAESVEVGRWSPSFLAAIDWALKLQPDERPQDVQTWREQLFAAHAASLGVQEALRAGEAAERRFGWRRVLRALLPANWPLALKLSLAGVAAALLPMLGTGYYNLQNNQAALATAELRNLELLARSTAGRMAQLIADSQHLAHALGDDGDFVEFLQGDTTHAREDIRQKMLTLVGANPDIHLMMLMDDKGTAVVSSDVAVMGKNFAFREYFKTAIAGTPYTSGIVVGAVAGAGGMFYAWPVRDPSERVIGAVVLRIKSSSFDAILKDVQQGQGQRLTPFLVDGDGVVIGHTDAKALYSSLGPLSEAQQAAIKADQRFRRDKVASLGMPELAGAMVGSKAQGNKSYRSTLSGADEVVGYAPVHGVGNSAHWVVGVTETRASFEAPLDELFQRQLISVALVGLLFFLLALWFAQRIVRPIKSLTRAVEALKAGDYKGATVKVESRDEVGQLARTFNVLIDVLRQRERERRK